MKKILVLILSSFSYVFPTITKTANISFGYGSSKFIDASYFFLGAETDATNTGTASLVRARLASTSSIALDSFADETAVVNGESQTNPIYNNGIAFLDSKVKSPTVVLRTDSTLGSTQKICLAFSSESVLTTTQVLRNSDSVLTSSIFGLAASSNKIFAAVGPATGEPFGASGSGVSVVITQSGMLVPTDAQTGGSGNLAVAISSASGDTQVAFDADGLIDEQIVNMYSTGSIVYVPLRVRSTTSGGGVISLLVGRIDSSNTNLPNKLILEPVVGAASANFTAGSSDFIIGYDSLAAFATTFATVHRIVAMTTSTNNSYLIVNGGVATAASVKNKVFALPIVNIAGSNIGKIANKDDFTVPVSAASEMTLATDAAALVGGGDLPSDSDADVQEMFTSGDSVFVCIAGGDVTQAGIYKSSALFGSDGKVARWTEWQRVMGSDDRVFGGGVSSSDNGFMYLTDNTSTPTSVVKRTEWGSGSGDGLLGGLVSILENRFPLENGGVQGMFDFSETTSSFRPDGVDGSLSIAVATGFGKVALIETGAQDGASASFTHNRDTEFENNLLTSDDGSAPSPASDTKVMVISGGVLDTLGPINQCEVSRAPLSGSTANGWLFVSGKNGVAVLSESNGDGWDTSTNVGLGRAFSGITSTMSFKQLSGISNVRKIACDGTNLYVLTSSSLLRIALSASNFSTAGAASPTTTTVVTPLSLTGSSENVFFDLVVSSKVALLATSVGLFRVANGDNIASGSVTWDEVTVTDGSNIFSIGPTLQLDLLSARRGGFEVGGNLYVMSADLSNNSATIYRFNIADSSGSAIDASTVLPISEVSNPFFFALGSYRTKVSSDGAFVFNQNSKHLNDTDFLKISQVKSKLTETGMFRGRNIDITPGDGANTGLIVRNSASGAWMVPGGWGLRVNE